GVDSPAKFFWFTGVLSSFLDNAPTYLVFFSTAQGMVESGALSYPADQMVHMTVQGATEVPNIILQAISVGAVFMGANTYIGNGPDFLVKAIAEEQRVEMPGFFGYMKWSVMLLVPCFALVTVLFFLRCPGRARLVGPPELGPLALRAGLAFVPTAGRHRRL